jgi:hypothetical protein
VVFLCAISFRAFLISVQNQYDSILIRETRTAIENLHIDARKPDAAHPMQLTLENLAKASPLSPATRHWLRHAFVTVTQSLDAKGRPRPGQFMAEIHFSTGSIYTFGVRSRLDNDAP